MILDKIDEKRLLIALSDEDMDFLDITFNQLHWKNDYSREIIKNLLARAETEIGFDSNNKKLLIEAIPQTNGCFVLVTLLANKSNKVARKTFKIKNKSKPFTFFFRDSDAIFALIERIYDKNFNITNSSIIEIKNSYYLIFQVNGPIPSNLMTIIGEYGELIGKDSIVAARIFEKGNVLIENTAIENFSKYLVS